MASEEAPSVLAVSAVTLLKAQSEPVGDETPVSVEQEPVDCKGPQCNSVPTSPALTSSSTNRWVRSNYLWSCGQDKGSGAKKKRFLRLKPKFRFLCGIMYRTGQCSVELIFSTSMMWTY